MIFEASCARWRMKVEYFAELADTNRSLFSSTESSFTWASPTYTFPRRDRIGTWKP